MFLIIEKDFNSLDKIYLDFMKDEEDSLHCLKR